MFAPLLGAPWLWKMKLFLGPSTGPENQKIYEKITFYLYCPFYTYYSRQFPSEENMYDISVYASAADPFFLGPGHSPRIQKCIKKIRKVINFSRHFRAFVCRFLPQNL